MGDEIVYMLGVVAVGFAVNYALRALPFLLFGGRDRAIPAWIDRLSGFISPVIIAGLIVYSYSGSAWRTPWPYLAGVVTIALQVWKRNPLVSIVAGTAVYMLLVNCCSAAEANAWTEDWKTPYGLPPYDRLALKDYRAAVEAGIAEKEAEEMAIATNAAPPTFDNTIAALDRAGERLSRITSAFSLLRGTERTDELAAVSRSVIPLFAEYNARHVANRPLFERIAALYRGDQSALTEEQRIVLDRRYKGYVRSGALLDEAGQRRFKEIKTRMSELSLEFGNRILAANNAFKRRFGFNVARYDDVISSEDDRGRREAIFRAYRARGSEGDANDTRAIVLEIMKLRIERARMLGYDTPSDYFNEPRMAKNAKGAEEFLAPITKAAIAGVKRDAAEFQKEMDRDIAAGKLPKGSRLEPWDWYYYARRVRRAKFAFDSNAVKPYFSLSNVTKGVFLAAERLYGVKVVPVDEAVPSHHPGETGAYRVLRADGSLAGVFITDYRARSTKSPGAWMNSLIDQHVNAAGVDVRPVVYNVANCEDFLSPGNVETLFHEFGHALHGLLSECTYHSVSGTGGKSDYNEIFSQFNEHWALQPSLLAEFAVDGTGRSIPPELVERLVASRKFNSAMCVAQLCASSVLDLRWHELKDVEGVDVAAFEQKVLREEGFPPVIVPRHHTTHFKHIFNSGYSAGYFTYLWAEVMDCDLYSAFEAKGDVWNRPLAEKFRDTFLTRGGSSDPMGMFMSFMGRKPNPAAYFRARGLELPTP